MYLAGLAVESGNGHYRIMTLNEDDSDSATWLLGLNAEGPTREVRDR